MTVYEIFIKEKGNDETVVLSGGGILNFVHVLGRFRDLAQAGQIPGVSDIRLYEDFPISGSILGPLLEELSLVASNIRHDSLYTVTLFET